MAVENKDHIFTINPNFITPDIDESHSSGVKQGEIGFTSASSQCKIGDPLPRIDTKFPECYVKVVTIKTTHKEYTKYYAKTGFSGSLFDPWGMYTEGSQGARAKANGRDKWEFTEVSLRVYELYTSYLKTRVKAWFHNAERTLRNG
jgi:hypothetical protein